MYRLICLTMLTAVAQLQVGCNGDNAVRLGGERAPLSEPLQERWITVNGRFRHYYYYVPQYFRQNSSEQAPAVIALHGALMNGALMASGTQLPAFSETRGSRGFISVFPDGTPCPTGLPTLYWNDGLNKSCTLQSDDVGFISALIEDLAASLGVDRKRVYVTGVSNGAVMTYRLVCELAGKIAAAAPVAGIIGNMSCQPSRPVPLFEQHGTADTSLIWAGSSITHCIANGQVPPELCYHAESVPDTIDFFVGKYQCDVTAAYSIPMTIPPPPPGQLAYPEVTLIAFDQCQGGAKVRLGRIEGGLHAWYGFSTALAWDFLSAYSLQ